MTDIRDVLQSCVEMIDDTEKIIRGTPFYDERSVTPRYDFSRNIVHESSHSCVSSMSMNELQKYYGDRFISVGNTDGRIMVIAKDRGDLDIAIIRKWLGGIKLFMDRDWCATCIEKRDDGADMLCIRRQMQLSRATGYLIIGEECARMLGMDGDLARFRSKINLLNGLPAVVTCTPKQFQNDYANQRRAVWDDLQRLRQFCLLG